MNKVVLITGAARGIGRATAVEFAKNGWDVVINFCHSGKKAEALKKLLEEKYNVKALCAKADVSNEAEVKEMFGQISSTFGRLDAVVNNAGIVWDRNFDEITIEEFKRTLEVNLIAPFIVAREASKIMAGGAIVNVSSTNGTKTISPECLDYNASKVALQSLTRDLAFQFKPKIRVNAIAIGWADTDMNKDLPKEYVKAECDKIWLGRFAKPEQIAKTIFFLASENSSYINGEIVTVDGGYC